MSPFLRNLIVPCTLVLPFAAASAQLSTATLIGTVVDADGAAVPNATVTVTQTETNFTRTFQTKTDGSYREEFLPVGTYKVVVTAPGFKSLERTGVVLSVLETAELKLTVTAGGGSETIQVTADAPLVNLANSTLGNTVDNREIDNLPLINRDVTRLLQLVPGVQSVQTVNSLGFQELHVLVNGSPDSIVGQVSYYLDGGLNMTGLRNTGNQVPNPDAVNQFNVVTNNYSAQLGRYSSAVVSVITKNGTNAFHGSAFEFFRDRNFNAVTHLQTTKTPYNQHRFGATVGGPIRKDKDFFFASFGGYRFIQYGNYSGSLPSAAQMTGNFAENMPTPTEQANCTTAPTAAANTAIHFLVCQPTIFSPTLGAAAPAFTPYPGNQLPAVDATAVNIIKFLKANLPAQQPAQFGDNQYTYRTRSPLPEQNEEYLGKTDHQLGAKHRLTLSYFLLNYRVRVVPSTFTQVWSYSNYTNKQQNASISDVWTLSDRSVNQFWVNYTRQYGGRVAVPATSLAALGSDLGVVGTLSRPNIAVGGVEGFTLGQSITGPKAGANVYGIRDVLNTTRGKHSLYLGAEAGLEKDFQLTLLNNYGTFTFSTGNGTGAQRTTNGTSDFMAGIPAGMGQDTPLYANASWYSYGVFAQDDWRIRPNLTLNLGVRYDFQQAPTDPQRMQTNFVPGQQSHAFSNVTIIGKTSTLAPVGMLFPGDPGVPKGGVFSPINHVSPRVGFAFDPYGNGKTVVHGAAGLFFGGISGNMWEYPSNYAPYAVRNSGYVKVNSLTHPYQNDPTEFPGGTNPYPNLVFNPSTKTAAFLPLNQVVAFDPHFRWPYAMQVNFGVQQELGRNTAVSMNFVGSYNRKSPLYNDINGPTFNINPTTGLSGPSCFINGTTPDTTRPCGYANNNGTTNNRRPLNSPTYGQTAASPIYSNVWIIRSNQNSNYNSLQVSVEQRLTHHVSARGYYTWSKTLQSNFLDSTGSTNGTFLDSNYPQLEYRQRSDQDRRNMFTSSIVWKPDYFDAYNRLVRGSLNGWTVTAIWTANSGAPFTVSTGTDNIFTGTGYNNNRPSVIPGKFEHVLPNNGSRVAAQNQWFDTSAYCIAGSNGCPGVGPLNLYGNVRPMSLDAPGYRNVDASLFRDFDIHGSMKFNLRGEVSNVFNLTNLGAPTSTMNSSNFGKVTTSSGNNRIIQVGGRLLF